jgi:hypothetical protein
MKACWGSSATEIATRDELRAIAAAIRASGQPTMLFLEADNGKTLVVGLGHEESVLTFVEPDGGSFHSRGDTEREGFLSFLCRDQVDEFMAEMAVPEGDAVVAAEAFVETAERPPGVTWEADW